MNTCGIHVEYTQHAEYMRDTGGNTFRIHAAIRFVRACPTIFRDAFGALTFQSTFNPLCSSLPLLLCL